MLYPIVSVIFVSLISLVGVFTLSLQEKILRKYLFLLVSLATGALIGDAFIHLIPEALEEAGNPTMVSIVIIVGILIFFIIEKFLHWHHHQAGEESCPEVHSTGRMILFSDGVHNFIDGLVLGASYLVSVEVGLATTLAIILHEIPQEIGDFGVLIHSGYSTKRALFLNFLSALTAILGTVIALLIGGSTDSLIFWLVPLAAGGFIYIALSDLIPEMHKTKYLPYSILQLVVVLVGVVAMLVLLLVE